MDQRMRFLARLRDGERMTDLCREFGISRKTGYKLEARYRELGNGALVDQPRAPHRIPHRTPRATAALIVTARNAHPTWGPKKLRAWLQEHNDGVELPAASTIGDLLKREGLVLPRRRRRAVPAYAGALTQARAPNDVWAADYKGQFRLGDGSYCFPLTASDLCSRLVLLCEAFAAIGTATAQSAFIAAFREYGLPSVIRTDNGPPFASRGLLGLTRLTAWWLRLGIRVERIEPSHPEQNGEHERMHLTLKQEATRPAAATLLQQQERFDEFRQQFNEQRPHEALGQQPPSRHYQPSPRPYPERLLEPEYPLDDDHLVITSSGHLRLHGRGMIVYLSSALAGQRVGLREIDEDLWVVHFMDLELGHLDTRRRIWQPHDE